MKKPVIVIVMDNGLSDKEYREKLTLLWNICGKFNFEVHGYSSVFVGYDGPNLEMFLIFIESLNLKYHVEVFEK